MSHRLRASSPTPSEGALRERGERTTGAHRPGPGELPTLGFAMGLPTLGTWLYFVVLSGGSAAAPVFAATKVIQLALPLLWVVGIERERLGRPRPEGADLRRGLVSGLAMAGGVLAVYRFLLASDPTLAPLSGTIAAKLSLFGVSSASGFLAVALFYAGLHSFLEEYYWRWFVFGRLRRHTTPAVAVVASSLAFMAHHVLVLGELLGGYGPRTWLFALGVAAGGAVWALLYQRSGRLGGIWLSHALVDAALMGIGYLLWSGPVRTPGGP